MNYHKRSSKRRYSELSLLGGQEDPDFLEVPDFREDIWFPIRQMTRTNFNTTSFLESEITSKSSFIIQPESKTKLL